DCEKALVFALRFHLEAKERGQREGTDWVTVQKGLDEKLRATRVDQLKALTADKNWEAAFALATRLADDYPNEREVQIGIVKLLAEHPIQSLEGKDYTETRKRLAILEERFPDTQEIVSIRERLRTQAQDIVKEAEKLEREKQTQLALE